MGEAIGDMLPAAVGVAISPLPILGERSREPLERLRAWMTRNSAVIMTIVLVVIAAKLIGDAITGFSS